MNVAPQALEQALKKIIAAEGAMTLAQYMAECLGHPKYGYYMHKDPFGEKGDFTTAPEISQMFGEMIALWLVNEWQLMGAPIPIQLVELGPGRGTLMADILRVLKIAPDLRQNLTVHLVEMSPILREKQKQALAHETTPIFWHDHISELPQKTSLIIANEFFDALPVHQYEYTAKGWMERVVTLKDDQLSLGLSTPSGALVMHDQGFRKSAKIGDILEISPSSIQFMGHISEQIKNYGGRGLIIDYGYKKTAFGDSIQALEKHKFCPLLEKPGLVDITAHVNFEKLAQCATEKGLVVSGPVPQGAFLKTLGIEMRARKLSSNATALQSIEIENALKRLTDSKEMGTLFKVLALSEANASPPVGFYES